MTNKCDKSTEFIEEQEKECKDCNKERKFCELRAELKSDAIQDCVNKIMNTLAFRKLAGKTQVILSINGPDIRTRLTHTMEVANIARKLCTKLGLNSELAEAIALAHDIGHTPFGHVGERCLKDIVCGCNSLGGLIPEDLENSGFKHNIQGVRVLTTLENVVPEKPTDDEKNAWDKILWGVLAHTNMTWAKKLPGLLDDLVFIPSALCTRVFNCHFSKYSKQEDDDKNMSYECHRNKKHEKEDKGKEDEQEMCHPWLCAEAFKDNPEIKKYIRCRKPCYIANLWKIKFKFLKKNQNHILEYHILFDPPFPGIFYSSELLRFYSNDGSYSNSGNSDDSEVSLEALIVSQSDEIAQRLQDMEDGVNKGLILIDEAERHFLTLCIAFNAPSEKGSNVVSEYLTACGLGDNPLSGYKEGTVKFDELYLALLEKQKNNSERNRLKILREYLYKFYSKQLLFSSRTNLSVFMDPKIPKDDIDPYVLLDEFQKVYLKLEPKKRASWYLKLLGSGQDKEKDKFLHWSVFNFLEELTKINGYGLGEELLWKLSEVLDCILPENKDPLEVTFNLQMDKIREKMPKTKEIQLQLFHYFIFYKFYLEFKSDMAKNTFPSKDEFYKFYDGKDKFLEEFNEEKQHFFGKWKKRLGLRANQTLANLIKFTEFYDNDNEDVQKEALKNFEKEQKNAIIKSNIVEKNDGKADYILRRLFKAYFSNPHQLPDEALRRIYNSISQCHDDFYESFKMIFRKLLERFKRSLSVDNSGFIKVLCEYLSKDNTETYETAKEKNNTISVEISNILEDGIKLRDFLSKKNSVSSEPVKTADNELRGILDNSVLGAIPVWKRLLVRGICDHIAGMTDQEAISEYEKLYTGLMELV